MHINIHRVRNMRARKAFPENGGSVTLSFDEAEVQYSTGEERILSGHEIVFYFDDVKTCLDFFFANGGEVGAILYHDPHGEPWTSARRETVAYLEERFPYGG